MTVRLFALCLAAADPTRLAAFWGGVLGWSTEAGAEGIALLPDDDTGFRLHLSPSGRAKAGANQVHLHLTSTTGANQQQTVAKALALGGHHLDVGQRPEEGHVVLADPESNEFCVIEPGNSFLAGCGFLGELACDGSRRVGHFWSEALAWPLVWDQDEETAIRSPHGGPKLSWGGPPLTPVAAEPRMFFDLAPLPGGDQDLEVDRLVSLGATRVGVGPDGGSWVLLEDPDGHEFRVLTPR